MENQDQQITQVGENQAESPSSLDQSRRRLTSSALGVSAILTLASRPVLAMDCLSPSGFASGNLSNHGAPVACSGKSPADWGGMNASSYPGAGNTKFKDEFSPAKGWGSTDSLKTVMNLASPGNSNGASKPNPISGEFAAALLNIRNGSYHGGITEGGLKGMWNEYANTGQYQVTAGTFWNAASIVAYLVYLRS